MISTQVDAAAASTFMRIHEPKMAVTRSAIMPRPKSAKTFRRSWYMPSTARAIEPSGPRMARPVPQTDRNVVFATHRMFAASDTIDDT